jgi:hypothetical protein
MLPDIFMRVFRAVVVHFQQMKLILVIHEVETGLALISIEPKQLEGHVSLSFFWYVRLSQALHCRRCK